MMRFAIGLVSAISFLLIAGYLIVAHPPADDPCAQYPADDVSPKCAPPARPQPGIYWVRPVAAARHGI